MRPHRKHNQLTRISLESVQNNCMTFLAELDLPSSVPLTGTANQEQTARIGHTSFSKFQRAERRRKDVTSWGLKQPKQCHQRVVSRPAERLPTWSQLLRHTHGSALTQGMGSHLPSGAVHLIA